MDAQFRLNDVTLAAIVRDEKMNPAGGIEMYLDSHLPFFEDAVIVDTGSIDGTREILEEYQAKYPQLRVQDQKFVGFAQARNYSLSFVDSKWAFILDADELFCPKDFVALDKKIRNNPDATSLGLNFLRLKSDGGYLCSSMGYFVGRLIGSKIRFENATSVNHYEDPIESGDSRFVHLNYPFIKHFEQKYDLKDDWYSKQRYLIESPYENAQINGWKRLNLWRRFFQFPSKEAVQEVFQLDESYEEIVNHFLNSFRRIDTERVAYFSFSDEVQGVFNKFANGRVAIEIPLTIRACLSSLKNEVTAEDYGYII